MIAIVIANDVGYDVGMADTANRPTALDVQVATAVRELESAIAAAERAVRAAARVESYAGCAAELAARGACSELTAALNSLTAP